MDPEDFDFSLDPIAPPLNNDEGKERERSLSPTTIGDQLPLSFESGRGGDDSLSSPTFESLLKPRALSGMACVGDEEQPRTLSSMACLGEEEQPRTLSNMTCLGDEERDKWAKEREATVSLTPPPPVDEQVTLVRGLMEDKVPNRLVPGQSRFLVGLRCGSCCLLFRGRESGRGGAGRGKGEGWGGGREEEREGETRALEDVRVYVLFGLSM